MPGLTAVGAHYRAAACSRQEVTFVNVLLRRYNTVFYCHEALQDGWLALCEAFDPL